MDFIAGFEGFEPNFYNDAAVSSPAQVVLFAFVLSS